MDSDQLLSLAGDVLWQALGLLADGDLRALGCARAQLLSPCTRSRLCLHLLQLDRERRGLAVACHLNLRLCPGGGGECHSPKIGKTVPQVLQRLSHLAEQGDRAAVACMLPWIERGACLTRAAAIRAAARIACRGDRSVLNAVLRGLRNPGAGDCIVAATCEAFAHLVAPGEVEMVERVHLLLEDRSAKVRCAALRVLPHLVPKGDERAVRAIIGRADDKDEAIRESVMVALGQVVLEGDCRTISRMIRHLRDGSVHVRRATVEALQRVSGGSFSACMREYDDVFSKARTDVMRGHAGEDEDFMYRSSLCLIDAL